MDLLWSALAFENLEQKDPDVNPLYVDPAPWQDPYQNYGFADDLSGRIIDDPEERFQSFMDDALRGKGFCLDERQLREDENIITEALNFKEVER